MIEIINDRINIKYILPIFMNMKREVDRIEGNGWEIEGIESNMWEIKDINLFKIFQEIIDNSIDELHNIRRIK